MGLDRAPGEVQLAIHLGARVAKRDQAQDFGLTSRQDVGNGSSQRLQSRSDPRAEVLLAAGGAPHRLWQLIVCDSLSTKPIAPASSACCANAGLASIVMTAISGLGTCLRSRRIVSLLDPVGHAEVEYQEMRQVTTYGSVDIERKPTARGL